MHKVFRTGNSLAVVIPAQFVQTVGIKSGDLIRVVTKPETGKLTVIFSGSKQLPLKLSSQTNKKS